MKWLGAELMRAAVPFCFAVVAAAVAAASLLFVAFMPAPPIALLAGVMGFLAAIPIALAHGLLLGLPVHLLLRRGGGDVDWRNAIPVGFGVGIVTGAFGWTGLLGLMAEAGGPAPMTGWDFARMLLFGISGGAGGAMFWRKFPSEARPG